VAASEPLHVLRLCSVFEPPSASVRRRDAARCDLIGGMQNYTAALTRALDRRGVRQTVVTSRLAAPAGDRAGNPAAARAATSSSSSGSSTP
jgi:glycogen(starch) synthase